MVGLYRCAETSARTSKAVYHLAHLTSWQQHGALPRFDVYIEVTIVDWSRQLRTSRVCEALPAASETLPQAWNKALPAFHPCAVRYYREAGISIPGRSFHD
jgi:hypothetical protein